MELLKPKPLKAGDTIGFFSPSFPATVTAPKRFERAKGFLMDKGFQLLAGSLTGKSDGYRSGSIAARVEELNALIRNPAVRCIISAIGGTNANSLLPYIDYDTLMRDPKIIIGYSDATAVVLGIHAQTGLVTFYGPALVASFGEFAPLVESTYSYFQSALMAPPAVPYCIPNPDHWTDEFIDWEEQDRVKELVQNVLVTCSGGSAEGRLVVGNLNTIAGIYGSPYMPDILEGDILVIEDSLKSIAGVERSFAHLKACGVFDKIGGLVLGKHERFEDQGTDRWPHDVMMEVIGDAGFPILAEYDCCHTHPMITLPVGVRAILDADEQCIVLSECWLDG
jgi:muramoyltetrapeptide carboxypeptidase